MKQAEIIAMQRRIGTEPDGFWGPKSIAACQAHLRKLFPAASQWPNPDDASLRRFYGPPGTEANLVVIELPFRMLYDGRLVRTTRVHRRCADSLVRVLRAIGDRHGHLRGVMEEAEDYGGCYNNRPMRGGTRPSLHAYGAAIDLDADDNGNRVAWPVAADMPLEIMEEFAREGWTAAGAFWGRDAMHFQATRP
jgi:hypothetical protein